MSTKKQRKREENHSRNGNITEYEHAMRESISKETVDMSGESRKAEQQCLDLLIREVICQERAYIHIYK